jgi:hypothetical protein
LLNQVRSKDLATLVGLENLNGAVEDDAYLSTDDREMLAWQQAVSMQHSLGEELTDEELETFKAAL